MYKRPEKEKNFLNFVTQYEEQRNTEDGLRDEYKGKEICRKGHPDSEMGMTKTAAKWRGERRTGGKATAQSTSGRNYLPYSLIQGRGGKKLLRFDREKDRKERGEEKRGLRGRRNARTSSPSPGEANLKPHCVRNY